MLVLLSDKTLDRFEQSKPYLIFDIVFNWIGGIGELFLLGFILWRSWYYDHKIYPYFWLKVGGIAIALLSLRFLKDELLSRIGIAPPDYSRWFGPRQHEAITPGMADIIKAQDRAGRIRERGVLVEELLKENATRFERKSLRPK